MSETENRTEQNADNRITLQNSWFYFTKNDDGKSCKCKTCHQIVKTKSGNTTGLHSHLKKHNVEARKVKRVFKEDNVTAVQPNNQPPEKRIKLAEKLALEESLPAMLARMTSKSGLTFKVFETDRDLRLCVKARLEELGSKETLPKTDKTIKSYVMSFGEKVKEAVTESFRFMRLKGIKFSLSFDEWTSISNKRYINVIVFAPNKMMWSLGLIKITGRATAYRLMELILERLYDFGIDFNDDVVSITTDGASTMTKLGRDDSLAQHHLCLIHGVHLAVLDVLYTKNDSEKTGNVAIVEVPEDEPNSDDLDVTENEEGFSVVELETAGNFNDSNITAAIKKIREVGTHFRKSAIHNEFLQAYVKVQYNDPEADMRLLVDCKTRWNFLYEMLDRYWRIKDCVDKVLIDIKSKISISPKEKYVISCILITLRPVMIIVKNLSCRDSDLVKARILFILLFKQLMKQSNHLSKKFVRRLYSRIKERWTLNYGVLTYLHTASLSNDILVNSFGAIVADDSLYDFEYEDSTEFEYMFENCEVDDPENEVLFLDMFKIPSRHAIKTHLVDLVKRLYQPVEDDVPALPQGVNADPAPKSFEEILNAAMLEVDSYDLGPESSDFTKLGKQLAAEMSHFEKKKVRIGYVQKMYDCLMTTKPSSVESERAFSLASYLCSKLRSRLNDSTLDTLSFLRSFFRNPHLYEGNLD